MKMSEMDKEGRIDPRPETGVTHQMEFKTPLGPLDIILCKKIDGSGFEWTVFDPTVEVSAENGEGNKQQRDFETFEEAEMFIIRLVVGQMDAWLAREREAYADVIREEEK